MTTIGLIIHPLPLIPWISNSILKIYMTCWQIHELCQTIQIGNVRCVGFLGGEHAHLAFWQSHIEVNI